MKTIALIARPKKEDVAPLAMELMKALSGYRFLVESHLGAALGLPAASPDALSQESDLVVVLGGDGTLIHAARATRGREVPILGVNLGSLGFMTEFSAADAVASVQAFWAGETPVDSRMKLKCRLFRQDELIWEDEVLNDVVLTKGAMAKITAHEIWLDEAYMATYLADGIIFATPTGSTAYSLSAGGPIVHPAVDCVVVTPICPHALTQRPIVVPGEKVMSIRLTHPLQDVQLTVDGQQGYALSQGDRIEVQKSTHRVLLVRNPKRDYFGILREKLSWGER